MQWPRIFLVTRSALCFYRLVAKQLRIMLKYENKEAFIGGGFDCNILQGDFSLYAKYIFTGMPKTQENLLFSLPLQSLLSTTWESQVFPGMLFFFNPDSAPYLFKFL